MRLFRYGSSKSTWTEPLALTSGSVVVVVAREDDAQLAGAGVVLLGQAGGADLLEPHVDRTVGVLLLQPDRVLDALRAAGPRAVRLVLVERAGAEHEADRVGLLDRRVVVGEQLLEVHAGDDLLARAEAEELRALLLGAGGDDHDAVFDEHPPAVVVFDHAGEVADEAVEVGQAGTEVHHDVGVIDDALHERGDELGGIAAPDGPIDLEHPPPELVGALHEVHLVAHLAQRRSGRHAGDATADDDRGVGEWHVDLVERLELARPRHAHADQVLGLVGCLLGLVAVHPRRLVADVGHLEQERVEAGLAQGVLEDRLVRARRAAGDHDAVQVVLLDPLLDQ